MKKQIFFLLLGINFFTFADEWFFFPGKVEYKFGKIKIVQVIDAKGPTSHPDFILEFYVGGKMQAKYRNVGVEAIFPSPNMDYFLGLSNSGYPGTAFIVLDKKGNLLREAKHGHLDFVEYCSYSLFIDREWVNIKNPDVKFIKGDFGLIIQVDGCNGNTYNLMNQGLWDGKTFIYLKKDSLDNNYNNIKIE